MICHEKDGGDGGDSSVLMVVMVVVVRALKNHQFFILGFFQAHDQLCIWQSFGRFFAITHLMVPDYSNNSLHYNLDDRATRDAVLEQNQHHRQNYQKKPKPENTPI